MNRRAIAGPVVAAGMVLAVTACTTGERYQPHAATSSGSSTTAQAMVKEDVKKHPRCVTIRLKWALISLKPPADKSGGPSYAAARLAAKNTENQSCTFDGYPSVTLQGDKGAYIFASPTTKNAPRLTLTPGRSVRVDLLYKDRPRGGSCAYPDSAAEILYYAPHAQPGEESRTIELTDGHGKRLPMDVCTMKLLMSPPVLD